LRAGHASLADATVLRGDAFVCLDAARPGSIVLAQRTFDGAAVPRDRANKRNDVREKIVMGELNIYNSIIFHIL
jgi:hypothetical protein